MTTASLRSSPNLTLSTIEQTGPRGYIRPLLFFPLHQGFVKDDVMRILQDGLENTKKAVPMLTAEMVPDSTSEQKGRFLLRQGDFGALYEKDLRGSYPVTYDELRALHFPSSALPQDALCAVPVFPAPGSRIPVFCAQATFIEGGLILNICIMHVCADARSIYEIMEIWAQNCRNVQDPETLPCESLPETIFTKEPFMQGIDPSDMLGTAQHHSEYVLFDEPPPPPSAMFKQTFRTEVFYLSRKKLQVLKSDASSVLEPGTWVSTHDAVCALIWRCILAAQVDLSTVADNDVSLNTICVDGRLRSCPPLREDHIGCPMVYATPAVDIKKCLASDSVGEMALTIRRAIESTNARYIQSLVTWLNSIHSFDCLGPASFGGLMNSSVMMSSWFKIPFYDLDLGPASGSRCESVRTVHEGFFNGSQVIMPEIQESHGGGMEVVLGLDEANWSRFKDDGLWYRYAESR